ncbi:hypothetical protein MKZ38_007348 [Zalerion maritima]|uniref:Uncharacterized protein n=1 Tax=Zalerion maritima TaxID=339359 RepID=A0AAD5RV11_9PEZI|nr:hypothetical protein MKZ38_007348 [Zalerion maritima]
MAPVNEPSQLKRGRQASPPELDQLSTKKPRITGNQQLPTPATHLTDESTDLYKEPTVTPPDSNFSQQNRFSSPSGDATQPFSSTQLVDPNAPLSDDVKDEVKEGVWGYLMPLDTRHGRALVLRKRTSCPDPVTPGQTPATNSAGTAPGGRTPDVHAAASPKPCLGTPSGGYLIGRHPECDIVLEDPIISNRHCLLFTENKGKDTVAIIEDLSSNGTFVNEAIIGRNKRRELQDQDEIAVLNTARFIFRYPKSRVASGFSQQYSLVSRLGKGHFATVWLCVEKSTGQRYAVKVFDKPAGSEDKARTEGLQQEIAVLMGVSHPHVLCLKDTFNESSHVYIVLELAPEGELFNYIVKASKLSEDESRKLFKQLFDGIKYMHDRNIVHRDIKPENILLVDSDLTVKLADFGLAKIIGEESFTTTLCGTPSYVAPEILSDSRHRRYTKAVDVWSLGVVLYICLCGFPPFSDELYDPKHYPYTLTQQIRSGRFNYPSPYWDSVGDLALDLIDSMLVVDPARRYTIDQCLAHPWMQQKPTGVNDSTDGLVGGIAGLDVQTRRGIKRERTLISSMNDVRDRQVQAGQGRQPVRVYNRNPQQAAARETRPDEERNPAEFMVVGGRGDQVLYDNADNTNYTPAEAAEGQ